jgi:hypothetical protein
MVRWCVYDGRRGSKNTQTTPIHHDHGPLPPHIPHPHNYTPTHPPTHPPSNTYTHRTQRTFPSRSTMEMPPPPSARTHASLWNLAPPSQSSTALQIASCIFACVVGGRGGGSRSV